MSAPANPARHFPFSVAALLLAGAPAAAGTLNPNALPAGATLAAGQAAVTQAGSRMEIVQQTGKAILNWDTFNIGSGALVTFRQPGADAVILNRVAGNAPSQLLGGLSANGKVWLVNPAGIMVGQGATIDLHGFVASTLSVRDDDFLAGRMLFRAAPAGQDGSVRGSVHNLGAIATPTGGSVYLVGADVQNHGVISAPGGEVLLAAGATVELIDTATPGVRVAVTGTQGSAVNLGQVVSTAGRIGMAGVLVKNSGILNAGSVASEGGRIFLRASKDAVVDGQARILATGATGGLIEVTGERVGILDSALLDASGTLGGGTVLAGGAFQGGEGLPRAQSAVLAPDAVLSADALARGDGGKVVLWSDGATLAHGTVSARGGVQGGNGGLLETSGRQYLDSGGLRADTTAPRGKSGTLLLDPANIVIGTAADIDGQGNGVDAGSIVADPGTGLVNLGAGTYSGTSQITAASLGTLLATTSVALAATTDITVNTQISKSAGGDQSLSLSAGRDIALNQPIVSTSGALALNLSAGRSIVGNTFGSQSLNGGVLTATGVNGVDLGNVTAGSVSASSSAGSVAINAPDALTLSGSAGSQYVVTAGGDVTLNGLSATGDIGLNADGHNVTFNGGTLSSGQSQSYRGNLLLAANTVITSGATVDFNGALASMPGLSSTLTVNNSGLATFAGAVGATASGALGAVSVSGAALLKGNVTTAGAQSYGGALQINANTVLKGASVTLNNGGTGSAGGAPAALSVQAQDIALTGTLEAFSSVVTGGALAATSLNVASPWIQTGTVNVAAGTLRSSGGAKMTGAITLGAGAQLILASSAADVINGAIGGDGGVVKTGAGITTFNGANTYSGDTQADGGTLRITVSNALGGNLSIGSGGIVSLAADTAVTGLFSSAGTLNGAGTLTAGGGYRLDGATISANLGVGALTQASGSSVLNGSHGGNTVNVTGGTLAFGAANRLAATAEVTVGDRGALETAGFNQTVKTVASSGTVSAGGGGTLTATDGFTFTGGTVSGALAGNAVTQLAGAVTWSGTFGGSAIFLLGGTMNIGSGGLLAGSAFLQSASGTALSVAGASSIVNLLNNGTADVNAALTLGAGLSENAGVINLNGSAGRLVLTGSTLSNVAAGTVTLAGTHAAPIGGAGTFSNAGAFGKPGGGAQSAILTANTNTGAVSVGGGTLTVSGLASNAGAITVASGATLATASGNLTNGVGGVLAGSGTVAANVVNLGTIAPGGMGAIGTLTVDGTLDTSSGTVNTELTSSAVYDKLAASGAVTVGVSTVVNRTDLAGAYASGDTFDIVQSTAAPVAGTAPAVSGFGVDKVNPSYYALRLTSQAGDNFWIRQSSGAYVSGAWEEAANWQLGLPTAAQLVHIARPDTLTVTMNGSSGPSTIAGLVLGPANTLALTGAASLALGARASKLSGVINLGGAASLRHAGDLTLEAGGVLLGSGTVDVGAGTFTNKGKVSPGGAGIGTLTIKGNFAQDSGGTLEATLGGAGRSDVLAVTGNAALDGNLSATAADGYRPETNLPIAIMTAGGTRSGAFKAATVPAGYQAGYALAAGEALRVDYVPDASAYFNNAAGTLAWNDDGNWSGGKAPGPSDRVVVDTGAALTMAADKYTMSTLTVTSGAALALGAGSLQTKHGTSVDGVLRLSGDVTASLDTLTGGGRLALDGGALTLTGKDNAIGTLAITDGKADIGKGGLTVANYTQSGGALSGSGGATLTASAAFAQTGGAITGVGLLDLTQAAGAMTLGNITADTLKATSAGDIGQSGGTALSLQHLQAAAGGNVTLPQANTIAALRGTAGGAWSVQGVAAVDGALTAGGDIALGGAGLTISANMTSSGGNVTLVADEVDVVGGSLVASAGGAGNFIKVTSATASQPIKFSAQGGEDSGVGLLLYARDMAAFNTPTLVLGDAAHTGAMSFNDGGAIAAPNVSGTLRFVNNGAFIRSGAETISANGLDISAVGGIVLDGVNHVKSLAADNSGSGDIVFTNNSDASSLALGALNNRAGAITIDNTGGVSLQGPGAVNATGKVSLAAHSPVSINGAITSGGGINVTASTGISLGAAARLTDTGSAPVILLAQNGTLVLDPAARISSGGGAITLEARGVSGAVSAPAGTITGGALTVNSTELDNIAAQAAADAAARVAADQAAAEAAAKAAADKAAAEAAAKAAADKAAAEAAAKAAADKAAAEAVAKAAADKAAAEAAAKAAADKAAAEAAAKAAADKAAAEAAAKAAADKAAAEAAAKAAADKAAAEAAAKAAADKAAADAAAKAAADKAAAEAAAKAAADKAAAEAAARAAADEAARQAAENAAKAAGASAKSSPSPQPPQDNKPQDSKPAENPLKDSTRPDSKGPNSAQSDKQPDNKQQDGKPGDSVGQGSQQDAPSQASPSTVASSPASVALAQAYDQQTIGGGTGSFGGDAGAAGDGKDGGKDTGKDAKGESKAGDGQGKKTAKKMAVCK